MPTKILLAGEGGQGVQAVAKIIALAAQKSNKYSSYLASFGVEQRGGVSLAYLQISSKSIPYPRFDKADIVVAFCNRAVSSVKKFLTLESLFVYDNSLIENKYLEKIKPEVKNYLKIPAQKIALEKFTPKVANVVILGSIAAHLKEISSDDFEKAIIDEFKDKIAKKPEIKDLNLNAFKTGLDIAQKFDQSKTDFSSFDKESVRTNFENDKVSWTRFPEYCKGCGLCMIKCPVKAIKVSKDTGFLGVQMPEVELDKCIACGICQKICPDGALKVTKK